MGVKLNTTSVLYKDIDGQYKRIDALQGEKGDSYVITTEDYQAIANITEEKYLVNLNEIKENLNNYSIGNETGTPGQVLKKTADGAVWANVSGAGDSYSAGENVEISADNVISAKDTTYSAGTNIIISDDNTISLNEINKLIMVSPSGNRFYLEVTDEGLLTTTLIQEEELGIM